MSDRLLLALYALAWLALLVALGSGPAAWFTPKRTPAPLIAPIFGLALGAGLLTTASLVLTMNAAAYAVLLPAAVGSLCAAFAGRSRLRTPDLRLAAIPIALGVVGVATALFPGFDKDTVGPFTYAVADVWLHVTKGLWLAGHTTGNHADPAALVGQLPLYTGWTQTLDGFRLGLPAFNSAFAHLIGTRSDATYFALGGAVLALVPSSLWILCRELALGPVGSTLGAAYGIAASTLTLVVDGAAENLAGLTIAPLTFLFIVRGTRDRERAELVAGGILGGGLLAVYPEYGPPLAIAGALVATAALFRRRDELRATIPRWLVSFAVAVSVAALVAPYSIVRDVTYYGWLKGNSGGSAVRNLTLSDVGAWAFGVLHLYQLQNFHLLSIEKKLVAIALPLALVAVGVLGLVRYRRQLAAVVITPGVVSVALAVYLFWFRTNNEYALWKWLLLGLPFTYVAVAAGVETLLAGRRRAPAVAVAAGISVLALAALARGDAAFTRLVDQRATYVSSDVRAVAGTRKAPGAHRVFLEGADATRYPLADYVGLYSALLQLRGARISYDVAAGAPAAQGNQLLRPTLPAGEYERANYRYVFTTFSGLERPDQTVARRGRYALLRRRSIDVVVSDVSAWTTRRGRARPFALGPFELWIASASPATVRLAVETAPTANGRAAIAIDSPRIKGRAVVSGHGARSCTTVSVGGGFTRLPVQVLQPTAAAIQTWQTDADRVAGAVPPTAATGVEIRALAVGRGSCSHASGART